MAKSFRPARPMPSWAKALKLLFRLGSLAAIAVLVVFNLRRWLFLLTILTPPRPARRVPAERTSERDEDILILAPCRNEEEVISGLCQALAELDYPASHLQVVLIDDGSRDHTRKVMETWAKDRPGWQVLALAENGGKASALNKALERFPFGDLIFIYDADHRPQRNALRQFVKYFTDPSVAGVSGQTRPNNPLNSPSAYYATVESSLHQLVTMRAKDRLNLAPALLGSNCGYRRSLLAACGGFRQGALLEDSDLTVTFYRAGYKIRFAEDAIAEHQVPETIPEYLQQHMRWGRGFHDVTGNHARNLLAEPRLSPALRLELLIFSSGYLDRIALLAAAALSGLAWIFPGLGKFPAGMLPIALLTPLAQILGLYIEQRAPVEMWKRLPWVPVFFGLDLYAAARSLADTLQNRPRRWAKTRRAASSQGRQP